MSKVELNTVTNAQNISTINDNFAKIETALNDKVLYRDNPAGEPNALVTDVDANSKRIYNLPKPTTATEPLRLGDAIEQLNITLDLKAQNTTSSDPTLIDWYLKYPSLNLAPSFGNSSTGLSYVNSSYGERLGSFATVDSTIEITSSVSGNGGLRIAGLPVAAYGTTPLVLDLEGVIPAVANTKLIARTIPGTTSAGIYYYDTADSNYLLATPYDLQYGSKIRVAGSYRVSNSAPSSAPLTAGIPYYWRSSNDFTSLLGAGNVLYDVKYFNAHDFTGWIATSRDATKFLVSTDLANWSVFTPTNNPGAGYVYQIDYSNGYWVINVGGGLVASTSINGPWTTVTYTGTSPGTAVHIRVINGRFYLLGQQGTIHKAPVDPRNPWVWKWTSGPGSSAFMRHIASIGNTIMAMGTGSWSAKSVDDGETFSNNTLVGLPFTGILHFALEASENLFAMGSGTYLATSPDGTNWTTRMDASLISSPYYNWASSIYTITYDEGVWLVTYTGGQGATGFMYSTNNFTTIKRRNYSVATNNRIAQYPIYYANGYWVGAIGGDGSSFPTSVQYANKFM